ncbi:MAG: sulfatase-like hydrolase/transferase [Draconibacterium sp.]|nr:sulfatase-like hydrolase/transferase [Draconibacterium sp.]
MKNLVVLFITIGFLLNLCPATFGKDNQTKPNIIFFLADDMRSGVMGCEGNNIIKTPNLDRLAAGEIRFENTFVTTSICCCSRASILTGQYISQHGIKDFKTPLKKLS